MQKILTALAGKKTYLIVLIAVIVNVSQQQGWITVDQIETINVVLGFLGLGTVRAGISKA
jgi:hypothetical protein